jgi:hypothetical protein
MWPRSGGITAHPSQFVCTFVPLISLMRIDVDELRLQSLEAGRDSINECTILRSISFEIDKVVDLPASA